MPSVETFMTFVLALTLLAISPGPDIMLTIARGVGQGRRIALPTVLGNVFVAGFVQVSFLVLGLVTVVHAWPVALDLLRWVGAAYLIWLDIKMIATSGTDTRLRKTARISDWNAVKEGALNSLTNPKSLLFMFAFLPQFVDPAAGPVWLQLLVLDDSGNRVQGFLFTSENLLNHWQVLDDFEGAEYERVPVDVVTADGVTVKSYIYMIKE